ncbi:MAG: helix-turn-helix transcriptional regulator [Alphaproteobacteria bacterium]|nr:helix-turn-helix transcriptional regulator [Alphaproteobacteria bacterium]
MYKNRQRSRGKCDDGTPNPVDVYVGGRVRLRRLLLGMSQEELARQLGITFQQVQKYEKGLNRLSASRLWDISRVLTTNICYFFEDMSQDILNNSPRLLVSHQIDEFLADEQHFEYSNEIQELLFHYMRIKSLKNKKLLLEVAKGFSA